MPFIIDAHLDLSMNALEWNREYLGFGPTDTGRSGEIIGEAGKCRCNRDGVESVGSLFTSAGTGTIKQVAE